MEYSVLYQEIITRGGQLEKNVTEVNNKLKSILGKDVKIIEHANIEMEHLNYSKLHLNNVELVD